MLPRRCPGAPAPRCRATHHGPTRNGRPAVISRLGAAIVLLLAAAVLAAAQQKPLRPFTFILDFLPYGEYTPYFTALDKGWYREEGLDVKILRGAGGGGTIKRIALRQGEAGGPGFYGALGGQGHEGEQGKSLGGPLPRPPPPIFPR